MNSRAERRRVRAMVRRTIKSNLKWPASPDLHEDARSQLHAIQRFRFLYDLPVMSQAAIRIMDNPAVLLKRLDAFFSCAFPPVDPIANALIDVFAPLINYQALSSEIAVAKQIPAHGYTSEGSTPPPPKIRS